MCSMILPSSGQALYDYGHFPAQNPEVADNTTVIGLIQDTDESA